MKIISSLLIFFLLSQNAWAGLPPPSAQGQSDTKLNAKFDLQAPLYGITNLGGTKALIETGNINFIANPGAEGTTPLPTAFADGASTRPVALTGGSPNTTCTRSTADPKTGTGAFLMTLTTGASRQGEGCAFTATIPSAYQISGGMSLSVTFPFSTSGTIVDGDITLWAYDVTNSALIAPTTISSIHGPSGVAIAQFPISSNTASLRFAVYIARTSTAALTVQWDDVKLSPLGNNVTGVQSNDWKNDLTFTPNNFGTVTNSNFWYRRVGDSMEVRGSFTQGTGVASTASISLPSGYVIDSAKFASTTNISGVGHGVWVLNASSGVFTSGVGFEVFYDGSTTSGVFFAHLSANSGAGGLTKANGNNGNGSGDNIEFEFKVPIVGWSSQQNIVTASSFNISSYLASGSRVTGSAPTTLGQYRSYLRNAGALTFTETNGSPTTAPTATDGAKVYTSATKASADASNSPSKYDIFVGKNKSVQWQFYASAGKTGFVDTKPYVDGSANGFGYNTNYDPTTGVATIVKYVQVATSLFSGLDSDGGTAISGPIYFDIKVSPNSLAVGSRPMTIQRFLSGSGTYTTPENVQWIEIEMCGGGGGGGAAITNAGANGNDTTFGTSLLTAAKGLAGAAGNNSTQAGGAGGTATVNAPAIIMTAVSGQDGGPNSLATTVIGGIGGASFLGGAGQGGQSGGAAGGDAKTNSCSGGGGGKSSTGAVVPGTGGGAGAYLAALIQNPLPTYSYAVGAKGAGGTAGTFKGGDGADGMIVVKEHYQ